MLIPGEDSDPSKLDFQWSVVSQTSMSLKIQLNFTNPLFISSQTVSKNDCSLLHYRQRKQCMCSFLRMDILQKSHKNNQQIIYTKQVLKLFLHSFQILVRFSIHLKNLSTSCNYCSSKSWLIYVRCYEQLAIWKSSAQYYLVRNLCTNISRSGSL